MKTTILTTIFTLILFSTSASAQNLSGWQSKPTPDYASVPSYASLAEYCGEDEECMKNQASTRIHLSCAMFADLDSYTECRRAVNNYIFKLPVCGVEKPECLIGAKSPSIKNGNLTIYTCETSRKIEICSYEENAGNEENILNNE